jgi:7-cyano-7-deazaguanine synthase
MHDEGGSRGTGRKAVVLLSGGLDSTTVLAIARSQGFTPYALSFRYGQRHECEIAAAREIARVGGAADHVVIDIDLRVFGGSALTADLPVPKGRSHSDIGSGIPITYVPARNTIFLSYALAWAEVLGAADLFLGINALDYSGYPDCRPEYLEAFQRLADLATRAGVEGTSRLTIHAPLLHLSKAEIIRAGLALGVDYARTRSCYDPTADGTSCGRCDACLLRLTGFAANGLRDPIPYVPRPEAIETIEAS